MSKFLVSEIGWDTDGEEVCLPTSMEVEAEDSDSAVDVASDMTGFCIFRACVEEV